MAGQDLVGQLPVLATTRSAGSLGRTAPPCTGARGCLLGIRKSILNEETELMKQLFLPIALVLVLTACASSSPSNDDIGSSRLADPQYAYQDEGLRWWRRHWVQPYAFLRRVTYTGSNWVLQIAPQAQSLATLQLTTQVGDRPGPVLEFRCRDGATSFNFRDVTVFSPFHSNFEMFIDAQGERRWVTIARRTSPLTLSIENSDLVVRILTELEHASSFTIAVRDATPVRARFVADPSASTFSEFRSACASQRRGPSGNEGDV
ncbi:hypothetical protein C7435_3243 [Maricaulis maris]|jgi:hypothetical protein|uniref:Uncharacterized protein n=2 Tax=Maricaulaceae TaxID=2800061 RepID=A0A495CYA1_9PROT|nr:hypothetical protein C7435_3243 [Maricaulis maris]